VKKSAEVAKQFFKAGGRQRTGVVDERLCWHSNGTFDLEILVLGSVDEVPGNWLATPS
jgi:hypothetical protein